MDLAYTEKYEALRREVRGFLDREAANAPPLARPRGRPDQASIDWQVKLIEHGYGARFVPREYGGYGAQPDVLELEVIAEEFARAGVREAHDGDNRLVPTLLELGTEEQKLNYVGPTLRGEMLWCQGYSEPGSGSDLASLSTKAVVDGDEWVINGQKIWTSGAQHADMMFCLVRTEPDAPKHQGISYLLFPVNTPGIDIRPLVTMTGEAVFNEVFFTDVRVPLNSIVGKRGQGWFVSNTTLKHERGGLGDPAAAEARFRDIVAMMQRETVDGSRLMDNPVYRDRLLKLQGTLLSMKYNGMRVLTKQMNDEEPGLPRWVVKLNGCELNHQLDAMAIDILGELGTLYEDGEHLRDAGAWQQRYMLDLGLIIGGGTAQIQKNMIGERALGLPKEPKVTT